MDKMIGEKNSDEKLKMRKRTDNMMIIMVKSKFCNIKIDDDQVSL